MSPILRAVAVVVAVLVVGGVALIAVRGTGPVATASPSPSPTVATTSPSPDTETGAPSPSDAHDDQATLAAIEAAVEELRGLPPAEIGAPEVIGRDALVTELRAIFDEEYPAEERRADNITLRAMGLLEPGQDLAELQLQLLGDQARGFYDDTEQRMVVASDAGVNAEAKFTYAHEYTHALQDAAFGLAELETDADDDDLALARTALVEGDATLSMFAWALDGGLTQAELMEILGTQVPDMSGIPDWLVAITEFPYTAGFAWASALIGDPLAPDFSAIDDAYASPPSSTEQIIHIDKWDAGEEPIEVEPPDLAGALGAGWEEVEPTTVGEAWIGINLEFFGVDLPTASEAAAGWGGDRLVVASRADDAFALAWILAWDAPADGEEFAAAYAAAIDALSFPADVVELSDGTVLVAHASTPELLSETIAAAGG